MSYPVFDPEILAEYPSFLSENCFENVGLDLLRQTSPDTARTALSACATDGGEHCKTEDVLPPLHLPLPWRDDARRLLQPIRHE
jgi:hypothetical protein